MKISRELAIKILKCLDQNPDFDFPFFVMCQEYTPEDDDFVEIQPEERKDILEDENYQTFQLWNKNPDLNNYPIQLLSKGFIEEILKSSLENDIYNLFREYDNLYNDKLTRSEDIEKYGENEFFGGKREAFQEVIEMFQKNFAISYFPELMIVRYYELDGIEVTYSNNGTEINKKILYERLDRELKENKYLETYEIFYKGENISTEEERVKSDIEI